MLELRRIRRDLELSQFDVLHVMGAGDTVVALTRISVRSSKHLIDTAAHAELTRA